MVFGGTNRNFPARSTLVVKLLALYAHRESQTYSVTDRLTDNTMMPIADHTV